MTLDGRAPQDRPPVTLTDILVGRPVRAQTMYDLAYLAHWVMSRGQCVVPQHAVGIESSGTTTLRYKPMLGGRALGRVWVMDIRAVGTTGDVSFFSVAPGAESAESDLREVYPSPVALIGTPQRPGIYFEGAGAGAELTRATAATELTLTVTHDDGVAYRIESVACWEMPRPALDSDSVDYGLSLDTYFPRRPVLSDPSTPRYTSWPGIFDASLAGGGAKAGVPLRRVGHFARFGDLLELKVSGWTSLTELPYRVLPRLGAATDTTRDLTFDLYAMCTDGSTAGEYKLVDAAAASSSSGSIPAGSTSAAWMGTITKTVKCEDNTTADGLRGGTYDTLDVQVRRTAGAGSIYVYGWVCYEAT